MGLGRSIRGSCQGSPLCGRRPELTCGKRNIVFNCIYLSHCGEHSPQGPLGNKDLASSGLVKVEDHSVLRVGRSVLLVGRGVLLVGPGIVTLVGRGVDLKVGRGDVG